MVSTLNRNPFPSINPFSGYMRYIQDQRQPSVQYWRHLLDGSELSRLGFDGPDGINKTIIKQKLVVDAPRSNFTAANTFIVTCASAISKLTKSNDVTVGLLVSGRATLPHQLDTAGPCVNVIPLTVNFDSSSTFDDVIQSVQHYRVTGLAFEASQLSDIIKESTTWAPTDKFGFVLQFQNIDENPTFKANRSYAKLEVYEKHTVYNPPAISIVAKPVKDKWEITFSANPSL